MNDTFIEFINRHAHFYRAQLDLSIKYGVHGKEEYIKQWRKQAIKNLKYFMDKRKTMHYTDLEYISLKT